MRPEILFPYYADVKTVKGVGPKLAPVLSQHVGTHVRDLAFFLPTGVIKRPRVALVNARIGEIQTIAVTIGGYPPAPSKGPQRVDTLDGPNHLTLVYFHRIRGFETQHPIGARRLVSGKLESFNHYLQMAHPDYLVDEARADEIPACEPVYPATLDLGSRTIRKLAANAVAAVPALPEWHDDAIINKYMWPSFHQALETAHNPQSE
ncbi:MAG: ATP-dependent DNA helicase RecG, partial [Asticcacaulis sp.]|nr:ATP-dependent DNA helicase RecG [Asticcacaulis sp.]